MALAANRFIQTYLADEEARGVTDDGRFTIEYFDPVARDEAVDPETLAGKAPSRVSGTTPPEFPGPRLQATRAVGTSIRIRSLDTGIRWSGYPDPVDHRVTHSAEW